MAQFQTIPNKHYFTIGEVSKICSVEAHVLRYWEQVFPDLAPVRRRGQRRYYSRQEIQLIQRIIELLYDRGFTIQGAKKQLKLDEQGEANGSNAYVDEINQAIVQLEEVVELLESDSNSH